MESCGMDIVKYLLFFFNLLFTVSGIGIIVAGGVVLADIDDYRTFMESRILAPPIVLIVVGTIVFLVAFLGCCGAIKENYTMLVAYAVLLLVIFIAEFAVGITAAVAKDDFSAVMKTSMNKSLSHYEKFTIERNAWDKLQTKFECCGVEHPQDWNGHLTSGKVPPTCCMSTAPEGARCSNSTYNSPGIYQRGCFDKLKNRVKDGALVLAGVGIGIAFVELAGVVLALLMASSIKNSEQK
ncbi:CD63 antigen [Anabrus simplex]|uniref:CD63 antigen n=1 Tax=Anabrus simplex TaxID=316456 RepID=UPI0034DD5506